MGLLLDSLSPGPSSTSSEKIWLFPTRTWGGPVVTWNRYEITKDIGWAMAKVMWLRRIGSHLHTRNLVEHVWVLGARCCYGCELCLVIVSWWLVVVFGSFYMPRRRFFIETIWAHINQSIGTSRDCAMYFFKTWKYLKMCFQDLFFLFRLVKHHPMLMFFFHQC